MSKIAGVVIIYYPEKTDLLKNIQSYIGVLDILYVIDNTGIPDPVLYQGLQAFQTIKYIPNQQNKGVAAALNTAALLAFENDYNWLLTMDQDSYFEEKQLTFYIRHFINLFYESRHTAVIGLSYFKNPMQDVFNTAIYKDVNAVITSGSFVQLDIWNKLKGYDEKLFIDEVDHEYCYRAIQNGLRVILFENIYLNHVFGINRTAGYLGIFEKRNRIIHSPARVYFMVRNYLYVRKTYKAYISGEFGTRDKQVLTFLKNNLFFSGNFWENLKSIIKGYRDFRRYDFSSGI